MALTTMDGLVTALTAGQQIMFYKAAFSTEGAGFYHSLWKSAGYPGAGSTPATGAGAAASSATTGSVAFTNAGGGNTLYIGRASLSSATIGNFILYDRLVETSGLDGTTTSAQTVNSAALTRYTDGVGVQLFIEWYTATGATSVNITVSYTNQANTSGKTTTTTFTPASAPTAGQMLLVPLAAGDTGIRSVESITLSGTTGTAGNFGITLAKPLMNFPISIANQPVFMDAIAAGLPPVTASACLALMVLASATSHGAINGMLTLIEG